jgi:glutamate synthase domain-containing protein 2/glutamate synthase domain-containing protein 1/glutamate synthase domain-containing protein 3
MYPKAQGLYDPRYEHDACGIGAVVHISGQRDHAIIEHAKQVLLNLHHRGAAGADETTGDGAGILFQIPHEFFAQEARLGFDLPPAGKYGVGMVFGAKDAAVRRRCEVELEAALAHYGLTLLGWRDVPVQNQCLGAIALMGEPVVRQIFVGAGGFEGEELERKLFLARKRAERLVREAYGDAASDFYLCSLSARTIVYKGMFMAAQLFAYYPDLSHEQAKTALAIVHQRYSTNTFPNWRLAQPFRVVAHNGEINTLSGNVNRMRAREGSLKSPLFGDDNPDLFPVLLPGGSDSAQFDNVVELLVRAGRSLPHSMMMMIPEAFGTRYHISTDKRSFYEYHSMLMEPWDGPAAMIFTDGRLVGGTLDRNGLRPCRYVVTDDDLVVMASEVGVIDFPPQRIRMKGRLQPGRMFLVDTVEGRLIADNEIKSKIARQKPYRRWVEQNRIELLGLFAGAHAAGRDSQSLFQQLRAFGYSREDLNLILLEMAVNGQEPVGSMGNDTPLAVLSDKPRSLFNYFKQLFAQVTNPPIDPLREGLVMSLMSHTGKEHNLLEETPEHCRQLKLPHPILTSEDIERLRTVSRKDFKVATIDATFGVHGPGGQNLRQGLEDLLAAAEKAIADGACLLIVSDRKLSPSRAPIPALLATAALHHGLMARHLRGQTGIIVESGEPREIMHFCLLCGYGATAVNPYLALETLAELHRRGEIPPHMEMEEVIDRYISAVKKGILKTISKMGISTLRSYRAAQLFEAIGLNRDVIDAYFTGTSSRIGGIGLEQIAADALARHSAAFTPLKPGQLELEFGGDYSYRDDGEQHLWNPRSVARLQHAVRQNDPKAYADYAQAINDQSRKLCTLRGLFEFVPGEPVPLEEVESAEAIVKRFCTGAMSHGSISKEAHETMALAMNGLGGMSNTGEGGEDPARYARGNGAKCNEGETPATHADRMSASQPLNSAIKQVASARFGVTIDYLAHARELQIKMAQGAKPGEGGQLPGHKVTDEIARLRHATPGVTLISPPPHHDIYSIEDLAQLIYDLKCANPGVKVSVKLVAQVGVGTVAAGVAKGNADEVLISGHDGGTGASPLSSIKHTGGPWELGLAETQQVLVLNNLRDRIRLQVDGQLKTGRDVVIGALLGAEQFGFGTAALVSLGCVLMRKCHKGTCPVGIASQDPLLRKRFPGKPEHLQRFMLMVAQEVRQIMAELGFRKFEDMVGRVDRLSMRQAIEHYKARGLDFSAILHVPDTRDGHGTRLARKQKVTIADNLDWQILEKVAPALERKEKVSLEMPIRNVNRTVGAILSNRIVMAHGPGGLPDGTIELTFRGSAGQSFGAFLAPGVTLRLVGDSNDYVGKGLSGGRIVVQTPPEADFEPAENVIVGNTLLYGATSGEAFINGLAGERFAVRNSGAIAVVEGIGDHGCEYMTGGRVVVLGQTGRNFGAGMSGGVAYVLDEFQLFDTVCNLDMVELESVHLAPDKKFLRDLIERHYHWTRSRQARRILDNWQEMVGKFVKVMPIDYRKAMEQLQEREQRGADFSPATEEVFGG